MKRIGPKHRNQPHNLPRAAFAAWLAASLSFASVCGADVTNAPASLAAGAKAREQLLERRAARLAKLPAPPLPPASTPSPNPLDQFIAAKWSAAGLKESTQWPPRCDDVAFLRRIYLDVIGVIPTVAEAQRFLKDPAPDKRARLADQLLARSQDYADHWTPFWQEALGAGNVTMLGGIPTRGNFSAWISRKFFTNTPYDLMVAELIDPAMPDYVQPTPLESNGRISLAAYIRNETHSDTIQSAASVGQVFLGTGMKCASCHNHFENQEWPQARFLAFAGLFAAKDLELIRCEKRSGQIIPARFPFDLPDRPATVPQSPGGRFHYLAQSLTDPANPRLAKTIVNRLWKRYLGLGLFEPVDDFRLDRPASHPELLNWLADDFMRSGFDLKHTIRLILTSQTYQLRYEPALEDHFDITRPAEPRYFRSPSLRRLTAEQFLDSVRVANTQKLEPGKRLLYDVNSTALTRALGRPPSRNEISTGRADDVAVMQALELMNGAEFNHLVYAGKLADLLAPEQDPEVALNAFYFAVLNRAPTPPELALGAGILRAKMAAGAEPKAAAYGDLIWALLASPEFQYIR